MDGRGRALDNVFIERLWRSLKYELIYPGDFATGLELFPALENYFHFYNHQRPHQALGYRTPADLFPHKPKKEEVAVMMGDAVPQTPWDLSLSFSRMDVFPFTANGTCRTIEMLDRNIGQRRDATRAPIQARNGWRPSGRRLGQPAAPSKDCRIFVQTMGSTSCNVIVAR